MNVPESFEVVKNPDKPLNRWDLDRAINTTLLSPLPEVRTSEKLGPGNTEGPSKRMSNAGEVSLLDGGTGTVYYITRPVGHDINLKDCHLICPEIIAKHLRRKKNDPVPFDSLMLQHDEFGIQEGMKNEEIRFAEITRIDKLLSGNFSMWSALVREDWTAINSDPLLWRTLDKWVFDYQREYKSMQDDNEDTDNQCAKRRRCKVLPAVVK